MNFRKSILNLAVSAAAAFAFAPASAVTITADYSQLGTVYQNSNGVLFNTMAAGLVDVTDLFKADVATGMAYLQNAIRLNWDTTITFRLADLKSVAVGDSQITSSNSDRRPATSIIQVDTGNLSLFVDPTPADNSEFTLTNKSTLLGGGAVNISRFGNAVAAGPAAGRYDLVTLVVHETEHSLGFADTDRFIDLAGANNSTGRSLTVSKDLTGFAMDFAVPILGASAHIDGVTQDALFNDTTVAEPGFVAGQRALVTDVELYALCSAVGCATPADVNLGEAVAAVPEPTEWALLLAGGAVVAGVSRRRKSPVA